MQGADEGERLDWEVWDGEGQPSNRELPGRRGN